jgi:hypothetical protein
MNIYTLRLMQNYWYYRYKDLSILINRVFDRKRKFWLWIPRGFGRKLFFEDVILVFREIDLEQLIQFKLDEIFVEKNLIGSQYLWMNEDIDKEKIECHVY